MNCYYCGCRLSEHDFCTGCGADVSTYKKTVYISNRYYNDGLEKATVRDLTGAINSLRQSLKFNKNNIEARNLLGLVYFEMGEVVAALSEWVISKNLRPNKNIADDYIDMVQSNPGRLESINTTIKKYNQSLVYCKQDSLDLAVIQLKKVLSLNPKFIRAHQLLALLYIHNEEWEKARKELVKCSQIDTNNTLTLRYLKEVENVLNMEDTAKPISKKRSISDEVIKYQSGNETIIQPVNDREKSSVSSLLNIGIGILIGIAATWFLILPARVRSEKAEVNENLRVVSEQSDAKSATIDDLNQQINTLTTQNTQLQEQLEAYAGTNGTMSTMDELLQAVQAYVETPEDIEKIAGYLDKIGEEIVLEETSQAFQTTYQYLLNAVGPTLAEQYYAEGQNAYRDENYPDAIKNFEKVVYYDEDNAGGDALMYLANAYRNSGNEAKAKETYEKIIELFPDTEKARRAKQSIDELGE
ncbi:MAG: tetratricopeptide repeat protein [Lachnospiraceae bacterium]|nr:tetratricopeptide repeat protein [Lachnospiraceae bacterium]